MVASAQVAIDKVVKFGIFRFHIASKLETKLSVVNAKTRQF